MSLFENYKKQKDGTSMKKTEQTLDRGIFSFILLSMHYPHDAELVICGFKKATSRTLLQREKFLTLYQTKCYMFPP